MEKIWHIVFPYKIPNDPFGWELKYSIRSIFKNFKGKFDITLIGDIPDWVDQSVIHCIPLDNINIKAQRQTKINQKIMKASDLYDDFILMNDDQYLMRPIKPEEIIVPRMWPQPLTFSKGEGIFRRQTQNTINKLEEIGNSWKQNMVSHCPYYYKSQNIKKLNEIIPLAPLSNTSVVFEVAYFNYFKLKAEDANNYRVGCYGPSFNEYNKMAECYIFNHDENGYQYNHKIKNILEEYFKEKCLGELNVCS